MEITPPDLNVATTSRVATFIGQLVLAKAQADAELEILRKQVADLQAVLRAEPKP